MASAQEESKEENAKKTILVTGANKGIGLALCEMLIKHANFQVILACRNFNYVPKPTEQNAKKQADNYEAVDGKNASSMTRIQILQTVRFKDVKNIDFVELDVCDKDSVKKAAEQIKQKYKKIDILINNAGMAFKGNAFDSNVVNTTLSTNHYGTVNVTEAFLPLINDGGRVLFTSSGAGKLNNTIKDKAIQQKLLKEDLSLDELEKILSDFKQAVEKDKTLKDAPFKQSAYGMSKTAMSAYSRIVAQRVKQRNIFVAAYCPGWCQTYMSSGGGQRTAADGASGLELLCTEKTMQESGQFWQVQFDDKKTAKLAENSWT